MQRTERRSIAAELRVATAEDGTRTISGFIPYNRESVDMGFVELIAPGAFAGALLPEADVLCLRDHDPKLLLGRTKSHTLTLTDSSEGLRYTVKLPNTTAANDLAESVSRGDLDSTSFGFICLDDEWTATSDSLIRTLRSVELIECSPCSFGAYPDATVAVRSCPAELRSRIETPSTPATSRRNADCGCDCSECVAGDCTACSDADCDCNGCDCGDDDGLRNHMHMTLALRLRK
jgi:HK97 family phage prohead protease